MLTTPLRQGRPRKGRRGQGSQLERAIAEIDRASAEIEQLKQRMAQMEAALERSAVPGLSLSGLRPRRLPPGMTAKDVLALPWPGTETTEEMLAALKAMD